MQHDITSHLEVRHFVKHIGCVKDIIEWAGTLGILRKNCCRKTRLTFVTFVCHIQSDGQFGRVYLPVLLLCSAHWAAKNTSKHQNKLFSFWTSCSSLNHCVETSLIMIGNKSLLFLPTKHSMASSFELSPKEWINRTWDWPQRDLRCGRGLPACYYCTRGKLPPQWYECHEVRRFKEGK